MTSKTYPIQLSPFYRLRNKRKLAQLLGLSKDFFRKDHFFTYFNKEIPKKNGKDTRSCYNPQFELKMIQKRINILFERIESPQWVMMGKKSFSYLNNVDFHLDKKFVFTMDIKQFFDSTKKEYVFKMFKDIFFMSEDVAYNMTKLVTYKNKIPTGAPSSPSIIYWAYSDMFNEIKTVADNNDCDFSLYFDDMTFSSNFPMRRNMIEEVSCILKKYDLKLNKSKRKITRLG